MLSRAPHYPTRSKMLGYADWSARTCPALLRTNTEQWNKEIITSSIVDWNLLESTIYVNCCGRILSSGSLNIEWHERHIPSTTQRRRTSRRVWMSGSSQFSVPLMKSYQQFAMRLTRLPPRPPGRPIIATQFLMVPETVCYNSISTQFAPWVTPHP